MIEYKIYANSITELKQKLSETVDELNGKVIPLQPKEGATNSEPFTKEPPPPVATTEPTKPKAPKKAKEKVEPEVAAPVAETAQPVASPEAPVAETLATETPKYFYSAQEFAGNFALIINTLLADGKIDNIYLSILTNYAGLSFIYAAAKDPAALEKIYEKMIRDEVIVRKGDY